MSGPRGGPRGRPAPRKKGAKRRGAAGLAFAFLVLVACGAGGLAIYFGFLPGPGSLFGTGSDRPVADSTLTLTVDSARIDPAGAASSAPLGDSAALAPLAESSAANAPTVADSVAGEALYRGAGRCIGCHGATGEGVSGLGSSLRDSATVSTSTATIGRVIAGGAPPSARFRIAMPAYASQLTPDDLARLAAYVSSLAHPGRLAADSAAPPAPATVPAPEAGAVNADAPVRHPTVPAPTLPPLPAPRRP